MQNLINALNNGEVIIIQTDTVYGFATFPEFQDQIYNLKKRDLSKPLIHMIYDINQINNFGIELTDFQKSICDKYWPGQVTLIFNKVSFRIPANQKLRKLLKTINKPLTTTSANLSGEQTPSDLTTLKIQFPNLQVLTSNEKMTHKPSQIYEVFENEIIQLR